MKKNKFSKKEDKVVKKSKVAKPKYCVSCTTLISRGLKARPNCVCHK